MTTSQPHVPHVRSPLVLAGVRAAITLAFLFSFLPFSRATGVTHPPALWALGLLPLLAVMSWLWFGAGRPVGEWAWTTQLLADTVALFFLFQTGGGAGHPFVFLFLAPLTLGAVSLPLRPALLVAAACLGAYALLFAAPAPHQHHQGAGQTFSAHLTGMWFGFALSALLVGLSVWWGASQIQARNALLRAERERALHDEQLVLLGLWAASAAHELGTPLGTLAVVLHELSREGAFAQEIRLMKEQVNRCRELLGDMAAQAGAPRAEATPASTFGQAMHTLLQTWANRRRATTPSLDVTSEVASLGEPPRSVQAALLNLLDNAHEASGGVLEMQARRDGPGVSLLLWDDGPGLPPEWQPGQGRESGGGLGIGLFLARAAIERVGGELTLRREPSPRPRTCQRVWLPLAALVQAT